MRRIAVVDDEQDITAIIKRGLEHHGFEVDIFNDPQSALSGFKPSYYDLIIVDIRMPRMTGFDLYRELKRRDNDIRICFLTAFEIYYEEFRKLFPTIDVKVFIRKPISISNLVNQINTIIALK